MKKTSLNHFRRFPLMKALFEAVSMKKIIIFVGIMSSCLILSGCSNIKAKVHEMTTPDTVEVKEGTTQTTDEISENENNDGVTKIGKNRYEISVDSMTNPDGEFTKKAKQVCPNGYKVTERTKRGDILVTIVGTIECESESSQDVKLQKTDQVKEGTTQTKNKKSKTENNSKDQTSKKEEIDGVTKIGKNRYEISVDSMTNPDGEFTKKAKQVCPNGYEVTERTKRGDILVTIVGTIECE